MAFIFLTLSRWTGPKQYKTFNAQQQIKGNHPELIANGKMSIKKNHQPEDFSSPVFNTPYKNICDKEHKTTNVSKSSVFQPPYKSADNAGHNTPSEDKAAKLPPVSTVSNHVSEGLSIDQITEEVSSSSPVEDMISDQVIQSRKHARIAQIKIIQSKEQSKDTKPLLGQLYSKKTLGKQLPLKEAVQDYRPRTYSKQQVSLNYSFVLFTSEINFMMVMTKISLFRFFYYLITKSY